MRRRVRVGPGRMTYVERGITACCKWLQSFDAFLHDVGPRPSAKHSVDRIDNNGNYEYTIAARLKANWTVEEALLTPTHARRERKEM